MCGDLPTTSSPPLDHTPLNGGFSPLLTGFVCLCLCVIFVCCACQAAAPCEITCRPSVRLSAPPLPSPPFCSVYSVSFHQIDPNQHLFLFLFLFFVNVERRTRGGEGLDYTTTSHTYTQRLRPVRRLLCRSPRVRVVPNKRRCYCCFSSSFSLFFLFVGPRSVPFRLHLLLRLLSFLLS